MKKIQTMPPLDVPYEPLSAEEAAAAQEKITAVIDNIATVIKGKREQIEMVVLCLLAGGHVLIEDIPGVGKTSLVSALAKSIACGFSRIQFTPDVMPSDISGFSIYNQKTQEFEFRPGAAMSNIVLADEINRATAKTQSSMLEIMEERQVTVDSHTYRLEPPFMVLATQNPIESLGTYQLPEAQIDRFMIKLSLGYPSFDDEVDVVLGGKAAKQQISDVTDGTQIVDLIGKTERVIVSRQAASYIVHIVTATRNHPDIQLGSSPRGSIALFALSRAYAMSQGRNYVLPDDVKRMAPYVLCHRMTLTHAAKTEKRRPEDVMAAILGDIVVPTMMED
ncbi:MAG: MoxR family ATPase [Lachnospiraceae bacterium]|nr:MoxR family ATPase [Lachnospiraceae bacterium]